MQPSNDSSAVACGSQQVVMGQQGTDTATVQPTQKVLGSVG